MPIKLRLDKYPDVLIQLFRVNYRLSLPLLDFLLPIVHQGAAEKLWPLAVRALPLLGYEEYIASAESALRSHVLSRSAKLLPPMEQGVQAHHFRASPAMHLHRV